MSSNKRFGLIMAGGSGNRFWPASTPNMPKQFLKICDPNKSLIQLACDRLLNVIPASQLYVATSKKLEEQLIEHLPNVRGKNFFSEPLKRNTLGCLIWSTANLCAKFPNDWQDITLAIVPADQHISPNSEFTEALLHVFEFCEKEDAIATIGLKPTRPETGYGYIQIEQKNKSSESKIHKVLRFLEKPNKEKAQQFFEDGDHFWNGGMFFWRISVFFEALRQTSPELPELILAIAKTISEEKMEEATKLFENVPDISIDYALIEKANNVWVYPASFSWDDVGSWDALDRIFKHDENKNIIKGDVLLLDSTNSIIDNQHPELATCLIGVDNLVVVTTPQAVLICPKEKVQEVKRMAKAYYERKEEAIAIKN